jgi:hypothetical protein
VHPDTTTGTPDSSGSPGPTLPPAGSIRRSGSSARLQWCWCPDTPRRALRLAIPLPRTNPPPPEPPGSPANRPAPTRTPRPANTVAPPDHPHGCKDVASMFLGCSLVVSGFLVPLFVPSCPRSRRPRHAKTSALRPCPPPSACTPIRSSRPASRQPTVAISSIETAAALSRLQ